MRGQSRGGWQPGDASAGREHGLYFERLYFFGQYLRAYAHQHTDGDGDEQFDEYTYQHLFVYGYGNCHAEQYAN